jgi:two-component system nitrogen regulation sensor histidine kinase NtrY
MTHESISDRAQRYLKDGRWIAGGLAAVLAVLSAIYYLIIRSTAPELATNKLLLFVLWYINLILILVILFVLFRNLFKLAVERHHRIFGSKLKTKLVSTYVLLALVPGLLLFVYGSQLLQGWIDTWFDEGSIKGVLEQGSVVAEELNRRIEEETEWRARRALAEIDTYDLLNSERRPILARRVQRLLTELEIDYLGVYADTNFVHGVVLPQSGLTDLPETGNRFLVDTLRSGEETMTLEQGSARLVLAGVAGGTPGAEGRIVVVAAQRIPPELAEPSAQLIQAHQGYRQIEVQKGDIKATYRLLFLLVTLVVLLSTSWVGFYIARRITVPIEAMAEATRRLSEGDLDYVVEVPADDELGILVQSFNRMTQDLRRNKDELLAINTRLDDERALVAAVLDNVAAGVVSVDDQGRVLTCNRAAVKMLRHQTPPIGRPIQKVWSDPARSQLAAMLDEATDETPRVTRTLRLVLGGQWKTFEVKVRAMQQAAGQARGRVMVLEDLTELMDAQQRAAWNEAARRVAHEIKNPLTPIRLSAERILKRYQMGDEHLGEAIETGVAMIRHEVDSLRQMVDEFSRFARMRPPHLRPADIETLIGETVQLYAGLKRGVAVSAKVGPGTGDATIDRAQIKQVLINLIDNAMEAIEPPGSIEVSAARANGALEIAVADTGPGVPPEARDKLFMPHFSTKGRGTGLGLSIVHRIIREHHGSVKVEDNQPHGTIFSVKIPQA